MKNYWRKLAVLALGLFAVVFFFRLTVFSGFEYIPSDVGDGQLMFGIVDHWRQFFSGQCAWNDLRIFWPMENTLAYSDTFFIEGIPYSIMCLFGMDHLVAYTLTFMMLAFVGYLSMYWLLRQFFCIRWWLAAFFAVIFVNIASMQIAITYSSHLQMSIAWLAPLFVGMIWRALENGRRSVYWSAGAAALLSIMFFTAFYMTWFLVFFLCVLAGLWGLSQLLRSSPKKVFQELKGKSHDLLSWIVDHRKPVAAFVVTFGLTILPFLLLYLPASKQFGKRPFSEVINTLPYLCDFVNVSERNYFWGWLVKTFTEINRPYAWELYFGIPPLTLILFLAAFSFFASRYFRKKTMTMLDRIVLTSGVAVLLTWILLLRVGNHSAWYLIFNIVPGAGAMRCIFRGNLIFGSVGLVVSAVFLNRFLSGKRLAAVVITLLAGIVFLEQNIPTCANARIVRSVENAKIALIPPPPSDARVFYILPDFSLGKTSMIIQNINALLIAGKYGLDTINGYSGQFPARWNLNIADDRYFRNADSWLSMYTNLDGVYALDAKQGKWLKPDFTTKVAEYTLGVNIINSRIFDKYAWIGWSDVESWGVWNDGKRAEFRFRIRDTGHDLVIKMDTHSFNANGVKQNMSMSVNGRVATKWTLSKGEYKKLSVPVKASELENGLLNISFDLPDAVSPLSTGKGGDARVLSLGLDSFVIEKAE